MPSGRRGLPPSEIIGGVQVLHRAVRADGIDLHVAVAGDGPPIILLHGFPENWRTWERQLPALVQAGFSVWAPDLRGYNLSDRPRDVAAYAMRHLVEDVAALVRATGQGRAHIGGHDWGGVIAWTFAGHRSELVDKLVIVNAPHLELYARQVRRPAQMFKSSYVLFFQLPWLPERVLSARDFARVRAMFTRLPATSTAFSATTIDEYIEALSKPGALTAALNYYRANFGTADAALGRSARIGAETLVVWGDRDPALGLELLEGIETVAPRVRLHRFPDAGHWVHREASDEVNRVVAAFLAATRT